eukprot:TRINITY_DN20178_c0_g1_i1.p1 TRINITY_DN20178_c0_g1~~TRINITY_DN20178_c0_g1_i1.p1  ORF type:complete len:367 (-),score=40.34 TRINITY_DN20178_c0_g1_i1:8-1108(-)
MGQARSKEGHKSGEESGGYVPPSTDEVASHPFEFNESSLESSKPPPSNNVTNTEVTGFSKLSVPIGRVCGVPIRLHALLIVYFVALILLAIFFSNDILFYLLYLLVHAFLLLACILTHELAHCAVNKLVGGTADFILLWPLGGLTFCWHAGRVRDQVLISLAGPLSHVPWIFGFGGFVYLWYGSVIVVLQEPLLANFFPNVLIGGMVTNATLFVFNLLIPAYPLDGGQIIASLLMCCCAPGTAAKIILGVSTGTCIALLILYFVTNFGVDYLFLFVIAWMVLQNLRLAYLLKKGLIFEHPLFRNTPQTLASNTVVKEMKSFPGSAQYAVPILDEHPLTTIAEATPKESSSSAKKGRDADKAVFKYR